MGEGEGFFTKAPASANGVLLIAESPHDLEGRASFMLTRLLGWAGFERGDFGIIPATFCQPPSRIDGAEYEQRAVNHCRTNHYNHLLSQYRVIVPMGNIALNALTGRKRILTTRGYVRPGPFTSHIVPTVDPGFIVRGQAKYASAFINDVRKAVELARTGLPMQVTDYVLDPLPATALEWAKQYRAKLAQQPETLLSYDIETPYSDDDESERGEDDSWHIDRIGFAYEPGSALSIPWSSPYMAAIHTLLNAPGVGVDWNGSAFDRPRVRNAGVEMQRPLRDGMIAWHVLHSDLPKSLGFVATFTCPWQPEWKHLSSQRPAFYNATDADVALRSMIEIEREMKLIPGLWEAYERDVIRLEPVLNVMETAGMPVNAETRLDRAEKLTQRLIDVEREIDAMAPNELRRYSPAMGYVKTPESTEGLTEISVEVEVKRCSQCQMMNPTKPHFRSFKKPTEKKPQNPCANAAVSVGVEVVSRWASRDSWKPSSRNLLAYQSLKKRIIPHKWDKKEGKRKPSMDKKGIKLCLRKYPEDPLYSLILTQRELSKIAGTYIGYVEEVSDAPSS